MILFCCDFFQGMIFFDNIKHEQDFFLQNYGCSTHLNQITYSYEIEIYKDFIFSLQSCFGFRSIYSGRFLEIFPIKSFTTLHWGSE